MIPLDLWSVCSSPLGALNGAFSLLLWDYCKRHLNVSHSQPHAGISMLSVREAVLDIVTLLLTNLSWLLLFWGHCICETVWNLPLLITPTTAPLTGSSLPSSNSQPSQALTASCLPSMPSFWLRALGKHIPPRFLTTYFLLIPPGPVWISVIYPREPSSISSLSSPRWRQPLLCAPKGPESDNHLFLYFFLT